MSISQDFEGFCENLKMKDTTVSSISYRYKKIVKRINQSYWESDSETAHGLYVGSYGRGTEIWTSDIDMIVQLPYKTYKRFNDYSTNGQSALIQHVKEELCKTYSTSHVKGDGQVIGINFTDKINFEIVPVFVNNDGSYTYPDSNNGGSWKTTNPKAEIFAMNEMNRQKNKNLKRLCRMARAWKDKCNVSMSGMLLDTLVYNFLGSTTDYDNKSYLYYDYMSRDFFGFLKDLNPNQTSWLAPGSRRSVIKKDSFQYKAKQAYNKSLEAIRHDQDKQPNSCRLKWREIYGSKYPL